MHRVDLHIVRTARGWQLQNARGNPLSVWHDPVAALDAGHRKAEEWQRRGLDARVVMHAPGKAPRTFDFLADNVVTAPCIESYALSRCGLS